MFYIQSGLSHFALRTGFEELHRSPRIKKDERSEQDYGDRMRMQMTNNERTTANTKRDCVTKNAVQN